jgi:ornithine cyclodeaminase/alanine dehydrogenase-like protein (mu-crystallin family)
MRNVEVTKLTRLTTPPEEGERSLAVKREDRAVSVVCLSGADVRRLLPMTECIELMASTLEALARGELTQRHRITIPPTPGNRGVMGLMPAHRGGSDARFGLKAVCVFPDNAAQGRDPHQGVVLLFDGASGELRAMADGSTVTALRTAAVTALATRTLARPDARALAVIGAGAQARDHVLALAHLHPWASIRVWSRTIARAQNLAERLGSEQPVEPVDDLERAVAGADVVVTLTPAREAVVRRQWLRPGMHVNAIGASIAAGRELDDQTLRDARLFVDWREAALADGGEVVGALQAGAIDESHIIGELGEVLNGVLPGRESDDQLTVFKSVGIAVEDLAVLELIERRAREAGVGQTVSL